MDELQSGPLMVKSLTVMQEHRQQQASMKAEDSWDKRQHIFAHVKNVLNVLKVEGVDLNETIRESVLTFMFKCCKWILINLLTTTNVKAFKPS
jgi:hypothetical protein